MIKNECEIVKDLMPSYIENLTSEGTKEFVENHIQNCEQCQKNLENLKKQKQQKEQEETQKGKFEIKHLKKYNKELEILKKILFIIVIILIGICSTTLGKILKWEIERKQIENIGQKNQQTIHKIAEDTNDMINKGNFELKLEKKDNIGQENETLVTYIYKATNDKFVEKTYTEKQQIKSIKYLFRDSNNLKGIEEEIGKETKLYEQPIWKIQKNIVSCTGFLDTGTLYTASKIETTEKEYNGKKCKILKRNDGSYDYELWVEKDTNLIIRDIEYINGILNEEKNYTWEIKKLSDEEIFENKTVEVVQSQYNEMRKQVEENKKIIEESNKKIKEFMESDNYTYTSEIDNFMDQGRLKDVYNVKNGRLIKTVYLNDVINKYQTLYGYRDGDYIKGVNVEDGKIQTSHIMEQFTGPFIYYISIEELMKTEVKEEKYNDKDCYVLKYNNIETWIDKESKLPIKETRKNSNPYYDQEAQTWKQKETITTTTYTWEKDNTEGELFDDEMLKTIKQMVK